MILGSVRNRLALAFFGITAAAIGFVYLYVVPQLRSNLTEEKLGRLERVGAVQSKPIGAALRLGASVPEVRRLVREVSQRTDTRLTVLVVRYGPDGPRPQLVVGDSELGGADTAASFSAATAAASSGQTSSAVERIAGERTGEAAVPLSGGGRLRWVAVLSTSLADVDDNVALIRRQILIAGGIALLVALAAGWIAARAHAKRLARLEAAAERVAEGDFSTPVPDEGNDEVGQLAAALDEMQRRLGQLDSARRDFIANASHELRTPIFSLGGFVELLDEEEPDPAARKEFVRTMREQVERLTRLTADLLDLSKLDADALEFKAEQVDLLDIARRVASEFVPAAERHGSAIELQGDGAAQAVADADRVAQIMRILLDNALTHTPEGTSISITSQLQDGTASLVVRDDGPGVDPHESARVFDRFYTGDRVSGSGLGLAIAREFTLHMGGDLAMSSRRGRTEFTLRLPATTTDGAPG
ncbi:MAG TPA: HAMP domain-containing sensor histidine kinase [Solirubrobacterales bacterium]